ncbi:MAG: hypothetical protein JWL77_4698 [Chthonomonadaceae bacterium]|nr:hypothetical protein [Chthonomonadaceae bacterium]
MPDTIQCPNCGTPNDTAAALCKACMNPLTAYSGELKGETYQGNLAKQVVHLETRPPAVIAMTALDIVFALFWPLRMVFANFAARQTTNAEGTNYVAAAFGTIGPILSAILLVPAAILLGVMAWGAWTQRPWAWMANFGVLIVFALLNLRPTPTALLAVAAIVIGVFWMMPRTKGWYGLS